MNLIDRDELKSRLDRGDDVMLVMTLGEWQLRTLHIPGSVCVPRIADVEQLSADDEIILYCTDIGCSASKHAYWHLERAGFQKVWHYAGGLADWIEAGYPVAGDQA